MFRNLIITCTSLAAAAVAFTPPAAAQIADREGARPWLIAFETPTGGMRLRLEAAAPLAPGFLVAAKAGGRPLVVEPLQLDANGLWTRDVARDLALELDGAELAAIVRPAAGPSAASNSLALGSGAILGTIAQRGDLAVTEFMKDPTTVPDAAGEWVEFYNPTPQPRQIAGWLLHDGGSNAHVIQAQGPFLIALPFQRLVFGNNADTTTNGGVVLDYEYSSFVLSNGADEIMLTARNGDLVDVVAYDNTAWPTQPGQSISLKPSASDAIANDDPMNWCHATTPISATNSDTGTPGEVNDLCP